MGLYIIYYQLTEGATAILQLCSHAVPNSAAALVELSEHLLVGQILLWQNATTCLSLRREHGSFQWLQRGHVTVCHQRLGPAPHFWHFEGRPKSHVFHQSYGWLGAVHSDGQQICIELCNSFGCRFCKVPPQLCDGSTIILTFVVVVVVGGSADGVSVLQPQLSGTRFHHISDHHPLVVDSLELVWKPISSHRPTDTSDNFC